VQPGTFCLQNMQNLAEVIQSLTFNMSADFFTMVVRRSNLLEDALNRARSKHFSPSKQILVSVYE